MEIKLKWVINKKLRTCNISNTNKATEIISISTINTSINKVTIKECLMIYSGTRALITSRRRKMMSTIDSKISTEIFRR